MPEGSVNLPTTNEEATVKKARAKRLMNKEGIEPIKNGICYSRPALKEYVLKYCDQTGYSKIVLKSMEQCDDENIIRLSKIQNDINDLKKEMKELKNKKSWF